MAKVSRRNEELEDDNEDVRPTKKAKRIVDDSDDNPIIRSPEQVSKSKAVPVVITLTPADAEYLDAIATEKIGRGRKRAYFIKECIRYTLKAMGADPLPSQR